MVPIVYCLDKRFVKFTQISIDSVLLHNPNAHIELIVPEYIDELSQYKQHICSADKLKLTYIREYDRISAFTYARLFIPELLQNYDKCLYIDGDIIVRTNLDELLNTEVQYIGAVEDNNPGWLLGGVEKPVYYNAGLLLMNLDTLRNDNFSKKCLDYIVNHEETYVGKESTWLHDQTTINALYSEKITKLDKKYNDQLSWNPPTKYENINTDETCLHCLTDYNKESFIRYAVDRYKDFKSLTEKHIDIILILKNQKQTIHNINQTITSILDNSKTFDNFVLHIFANYRNKSLDRYFDRLENTRIRLYDVTVLNNESDILEYAKKKLYSDWVFIVDENSIIAKNTLAELIIHAIRFNDGIVFTKSKIMDEKNAEEFNWPRPDIARSEMLVYAYVRETNGLCNTERFKTFDFTKCKVFPVLEFYNSEMLNHCKHGVSFKILSWNRCDLYERMRFYMYAEEMNFIVKRSLERMGFKLTYNEAAFINPYNKREIKLTDSEIHNLRKIRRHLELKKENIKGKQHLFFDSKTLYKLFKQL